MGLPDDFNGFAFDKAWGGDYKDPSMVKDLEDASDYIQTAMDAVKDALHEIEKHMDGLKQYGFLSYNEDLKKSYDRMSNSLLMLNQEIYLQRHGVDN